VKIKLINRFGINVVIDINNNNSNILTDNIDINEINTLLFILYKSYLIKGTKYKIIISKNVNSIIKNNDINNLLVTILLLSLLVINKISNLLVSIVNDIDIDAINIELNIITANIAFLKYSL
jgi:hypothetical protein